eukprot:c19068_g1_i1.p1 GENE.c19068_g1_i1~~c19068_g1_i1.p1  ORF type:complete len:399 (+),score=143.35 c19068_g1_i1:69-1265(+)
MSDSKEINNHNKKNDIRDIKIVNMTRHISEIEDQLRKSKLVETESKKTINNLTKKNEELRMCFGNSKFSQKDSNFFGVSTYHGLSNYKNDIQQYLGSLTSPELLPTKIQNIEIVTITSESCILNWRAPDKATKYLICCIDHSDQDSGLIVVSEDFINTSFEANDLVTGTSYTFVIFAGNKEGYESEGSVTTVTCLAPVVDLCIADIMESSLLLKWKSKRRSTNFKIVVCDARSPQTAFCVLTSKTNTCRVSSLQIGGRYFFHVFAGTKSGVFETLGAHIEGVVLSPVPEILVENLNGDIAELKWTYSNGATHYVIRRQWIGLFDKNTRAQQEINSPVYRTETTSCVVSMDGQSSIFTVFAEANGLCETRGTKIVITPQNKQDFIPKQFLHLPQNQKLI